MWGNTDTHTYIHTYTYAHSSHENRFRVTCIHAQLFPTVYQLHNIHCAYMPCICTGVYMSTYAHACMHTHAYIEKYTQRYIHISRHTWSHVHWNTLAKLCMCHVNKWISITSTYTRYYAHLCTSIVYMCVCMYACMYVCICMYVCMCIYIYVCVCMYIYIYIHIYMYTIYTSLHLRLHTYIHTYICIYIKYKNTRACTQTHGNSSHVDWKHARAAPHAPCQ
jgi:hypothetical protein